MPSSPTPVWKPTGAVHPVRASRNAMRGIAATWRTESAFRHETLLAAVLVPTVFVVVRSPAWRALLLVTLVLVVELLNTALEAVVDRIGRQHHVLSGKAKDAGAAAVAAALALHAAVWACVPW